MSDYLVDSGVKRGSSEWQKGMCLCIARLLAEHAGYGDEPVDATTAELGKYAREVLNG